MLTNKTIVLGISGSIAAYKICDLVRKLVKLRAKVICVMTSSAKQFVT
ncbi:bifunctional 4'-phosphopantothenoylcysteine decarboxylase/phosphopantothenoylcysteine synthetase, partial [bacterium]|nr:bifunctional 4'-phosphopantothenoylcysteine decarboxylase/phosphopantothenoylcysteine synthetase [bacterium]